jgi:hypothetical protein
VWNAPVSGVIDSIGDVVGKAGWVVLDSEGRMMCGTCSGMQTKDIERAGFTLAFRSKDRSAK